MLNKTSLEDKKILEERKINPENIYYIADNELEYLSAIKIFKVQSYKLSDFSVPALKKLIAGLDMKFDVVFSNPPYNSNIDIKILNEIIDIADEFVVVHPSTWILDDKNKTKLYVDFKNKIDKKVASIDFFNGNPIFNIALYVPCMITHINQKQDSTCSVDYFGLKFDVESLHSINKYGDKWNLINKFKKNIYDEISKTGHVWSKIVSPKDVDGKLLYCQLAGIRGNVNLKSHNKDIIKDDFYTFVMKDITSNHDIRKDDIKCTFAFNSALERTNFLNYLKTDFARFCLSIYKTNSHLDRGELEIVPWLDFTEEWDDDKLFAKFDVSQELQNYIRDFLPDYYGIRK